MLSVNKNIPDLLSICDQLMGDQTGVLLCDANSPKANVDLYADELKALIAQSGTDYRQNIDEKMKTINHGSGFGDNGETYFSDRLAIYCQADGTSQAISTRLE